MGYAKSCNKQPGEVLRMVQEAYAEKTLSTARRLGMQQEFPEKEILFSFLLCVSSALDGTSFGSSSKEKSVQDGEKGVRGVWDYLRDVGSPFRRESQEQRTIESPDPLFVLSWFLAQGAKEVAEANARSNAATFPLAERTSGRVAVLRGLGNSIVPQVAAEFIAAFLEAEEDLKGL
jgi:hypothetical protein